jgi:hypothetical protein
MTYPDFKRVWAAMTEAERDSVRAKAGWEQMSLWRVLVDWPSLVPERLRNAAEASREADQVVWGAGYDFEQELGGRAYLLEEALAQAFGRAPRRGYGSDHE